MLNSFLQQRYFGLNWVDLIFIGVLFYFVLTNKGFIQTSMEVASFVLALFFSYKFYGLCGSLFVNYLSLPNGIANALGFFLTWFISELVVYIVVIKLTWNLIQSNHDNFLNVVFGYVVASFQAVIVFLFFVSLVFVFPVRGQIKKDILQSETGPFFVNLSQSAEKQLKSVFGEAISETINFLTIKPQSDQSLALGFKLASNQLSVDQQSEAAMLSLVNNERNSRGIGTLEGDEGLKEVARNYAKEMFINGDFSHVSSVDGSTVAERVVRMGIDYNVVGENLAFAPDVYLAHQGLMNSEGHRENILLTDFRKVGIGVIDGGIYGKMFVQVFSD